jgi:hypothetical protein
MESEIHQEILALWKSLNETRQYLINLQGVVLEHIKDREAHNEVQ